MRGQIGFRTTAWRRLSDVVLRHGVRSGLAKYGHWQMTCAGQVTSGFGCGNTAGPTRAPSAEISAVPDDAAASPGTRAEFPDGHCPAAAPGPEESHQRRDKRRPELIMPDHHQDSYNVVSITY